jgi:pantoate--beta-alanine ligase
MVIEKTVASAIAYSKRKRQEGFTIGFVPTMGALHNGHLELVRKAREENDQVICSIFVNPLQFNNPEDLEKYPSTPERDLEMLEQVGCDMVFMPTADDMYRDGETKSYDFGNLETVMEGKYRPGHFNGVANVVSKLFDIVKPHRAYFGEKDFQQLAIVRKLVEMEEFPIRIIGCPIVREPDGLAMSSRNLRLDKEAREKAPLIFRSLMLAVDMIPQFKPEEIKAKVREEFEKYPEFELEYIEIVSMDDLSPVINWADSPDIIACIAAYLGGIRLIDNLILFRNFAVA